MAYASRVANLHQRLALRIAWDPHVDGTPDRRDWRRAVEAAGRRRRYAQHEAYTPGSEIVVKAVLPDGISTADLSQLLRVAGTYRGISPFRCDVSQYGVFEVVSITPAGQAREARHDGGHTDTTPTSEPAEDDTCES